MQFPLLVLKELEYSGVSGSIYHFQNRITRVFSHNILFYQLQGNISISAKSKADIVLNSSDLFFLAAGESVEIEGNDAYTLLIFIPSISVKNRQKNIRCCSSKNTHNDIYLPLRTCIHDIFHAEYYGGTYYEMKVQGLIGQFLYQLLSSFCVENSYSEDNDQIALMQIDGMEMSRTHKEENFKEILNLLDTYYDKDLKLTDIAQKYYYTTSNLSKLFVKYTGFHFSEYLTEVRLEKGMGLLINTSLDIESISEKVGFASARAFQQAFQKKYHMRPSVYRKTYQDTTTEYLDDHRKNLSKAKNDGLLDAIFVSQKKEVVTPYSSANLGIFNMEDGYVTDIANKNSILHVNRIKDLLLDEIQDRVRLIQKEIGFKYICGNGFLSDEMQIYFEDDLHVVSESGEHYVEYSFELYDKILSFAKENNMYFIINLSYMPTFLSSKARESKRRENTFLAMPTHMNQWIEYITRMFKHFYSKFGEWILNCPVFLWATPDIHINIFHEVEVEDFYHLYEVTYKTLKNLLPSIEIDSSTFSVTPQSIEFIKRFLLYCCEKDCLPDAINLLYIVNQKVNAFLFDGESDGERYIQELKNVLRSVKTKYDPPIHLMEYFNNFGWADSNDSMINAMLPIKVTLKNMNQVDRFGYSNISDLTTGGAYGKHYFNGGHGLIAKKGGLKPIFYALKYLSKLGNICLGMGDGFVITRKENRILMLLYYDIPVQERVEEFSYDNALDFYEMYLDKQIQLEIANLEMGTYLLCEEYINYQNGGGYERWIREGGKLLDHFEDLSDGDHYSTIPVVSVKKVDLKQNVEQQKVSYQYRAVLKPFELRFVELRPFTD